MMEGAKPILSILRLLGCLSALIIALPIIPYYSFVPLLPPSPSWRVFSPRQKQVHQFQLRVIPVVPPLPLAVDAMVLIAEIPKGFLRPSFRSFRGENGLACINALS